MSSRKARARAQRTLQAIAALVPAESDASKPCEAAPLTGGESAIEVAAARAQSVASALAARGGAASSAGWLLPDLPWHDLPPSADPCSVLSAGAAAGPRGRRKRAQVANFAAVLRSLLETLPVASSSEERGAPRTNDPQERRRPHPLRVVDFGCGSGAVVLALAALFPPEQAVFVGVDMKLEAIDLLRARATAAGLAHVTGLACMAEDFCFCRTQHDHSQQTYDHTFDVALALHACGNATDVAVELAARCAAAFAVSPCCLGKLSFSVGGGGSSFHPRLTRLHSTRRGFGVRPPPVGEALEAQGAADVAAAEEGRRRGCPHRERVRVRHPRSAWLRAQLAASSGGGDADAAFKAIARAADGVNHGEGRPAACRCSGDGGEFDGALELRAARAAKAVVEMDRREAVREAHGYAAVLLRLSPLEGEEGEGREGAGAGARDDLVLGLPSTGTRWSGARRAILGLPT